MSALLRGRTTVARKTVAGALHEDPTNGYLHLLNGLSYQFESDSADTPDLARVGYEAAVRFAPGRFWPHYLAAAAAYNAGEYPAAAEHFCESILDAPDRPLAYLGLANAAYRAGDLGVSQVAIGRALRLDPDDPLILRTAVHVAAARGEDGLLREYLERFPDLEGRKARLWQLAHSAALDRVAARAEEIRPPEFQSGSEAPLDGNEAGKQLMVEVTLLLSQASSTRSSGINLLDGLSAQFGLERLTSRRSGTGAPETIARSLTTAITVPQIAYSLNLFNTKTDHYRVLARPSMVAYLGQPSKFFIGRTVTVGVSGINLGSLEPIDVGISVSVTPLEITAKQARFSLDVNRSFLEKQASGSFTESLTTFRQSVSATAEVDFGRTLILSGLYEGVDSGRTSKTPILGDIPVVNTFFRERTRTQQQDVALVLVTPRLPGEMETDTREFRGATLTRLMSLWKDLIDPTSDADAIVEALRRPHRGSLLFRPRGDDVAIPRISDVSTLREIIAQTRP